MLLIVRLYPKTSLEPIWRYVENEFKEDSDRSVVPLYATQTEGMMDVGVIFEVKDVDDILPFLTEEVHKCTEVHKTQTVTLAKPVFFRVPKQKPENMQRYLIRVFAHPSCYKRVYDHLLGIRYPYNLFPIYVSYSLGEEDIIMNVAATSPETVNMFIKEHVRMLDGVDQASCYPVRRAKRFSSLEKLLEHQKKYLAKRVHGISDEEADLDFDWVEAFEHHALLSGALPGDI